MLAYAGEPDAIALVDPGRNFDGECLVLFGAAGAAATLAGVGDEAAGPVALRAGLLDREKPLLQANLAGAVAGRAGLGLGAGLGAGTVAGFADFHGRNADLGFRAVGSLLKSDLEVVAQVRTAVDVGAPATPATATPAAEDFVENAAKGIRKATPAATKSPGLRVDAGVAELVVGCPFLAVG